MNKREERPSSRKIKSGAPGSILGSLAERIRTDLGIDVSRFNQLVARYIINAKIPTNIRDASNARGGLKRELLNDVLTWKNFIKNFTVLNILRFDIVIRAYHKNGTVTEHIEKVVLRVNDDDESAMEDLKKDD